MLVILFRDGSGKNLQNMIWIFAKMSKNYIPHQASSSVALLNVMFLTSAHLLPLLLEPALEREPALRPLLPYSRSLPIYSF